MSWLRRIFPAKRITMTAVFLVCLAGMIVCLNLPDVTGLTVLFTIGVILTAPVVAWRAAKRIIRVSIWRLRNRLYVTYVFIGVVPLVLILLLVGIGGYIMAGQTAAYLVISELDRTLASLELPARVLASNPGAPLEILDQVSAFLRQRFPAFEIVVRRNGELLHYPVRSTLEPADDDAPEYSGITIRNGEYCAWSHIRRPGLVVDVVAPIDREMLGELVPRIGRIEIAGYRTRVARRHQLTADELRNGDADSIPAPANQFDYEVNWFSPIRVVRWHDGKLLESNELWITTRPSAIVGAIFGEKFKFAQGLLVVFAFVAVLFLLVELVSFVIGVSLTRTITGAIQNLYDGTRRVAEGDFTHRIKVKGNDQLAEVSTSFNSMTERLEALLVVEKEKERLQSELEIAREVQNQLFPRSSPKLRTLEITGVCRPARMVSGDYYDFLCLQDGNLAMAIGDVAGKGISAALLMASIQSIMRTQLSAATPVMAATANGPSRLTYSTNHMVAQLNRQLYENTSPEKYATFLFGIYNEQDRTLTYTNAGHLPPVLIRRGEASLLEVTGTVVGAFPKSCYEEQTILLEPGDLLVSYTDGITEPENEYGEEFGVDRLVEVLSKHRKSEPTEMVNQVMDAVRNWTTAEELPDDMTIVLARRLA